MTVETKSMPELRVGCVRHIGPYEQIPEAFERLGAIAGAAGLFAQPDVMMIGIYHDDPEKTPPGALRSDAAITIPDGMKTPEGLTEQWLPAGRYAWTVHRGPYELLGDVWARLTGEWIPASGHRIAAGPSFEVYRNTPAEVPKEQLVTELFVPIA
jgi:AraC family transcriptional regulator